ncbi:MAG: 50S ribosomal protein L10 [Betaproteobacteria bacterium]|nr:50S ribosomal protein L10 [Betaproteobacteria bacterium]NBT76169.1 50S ribosomal protein L10 [Betaproteobacteria bacterium]NBY14033.1 50S ribosomal protein L10 [Betaproteobacteria bacterium]NCA16623.1 50S ribosomal protein L10 [Betaproteobacteria bacterium]NDF04296.1 50S ribosomal protein L10 [Betaproteobacteria bacterium]
MALNREAKAVIIDAVSAQVAKAQAIVVAEYRGLDVARITELRRKAREAGVYLRVLKNTLVRRAVSGTPFEKLNDHMVGPLIYGISSDPVAAAKVMNDFAKTNEALVIKCGALPNSLVDANGIKALASLPSREELLAKLLGTMQAPMTTLVQTLNAVPSKFVRTVAALRDQREQASA